MSRLGSASGGLDPHRVAEVLVELPARPGRRGSGYRVSDSAVLTAAHVVRDAARVRVRFDADTADEWVIEVTEWSSEATADVASLTIDPPPDRRGVELARFGRVGDRDAVLSYSAVGVSTIQAAKRSGAGGRRRVAVAVPRRRARRRYDRGAVQPKGGHP